MSFGYCDVAALPDGRLACLQCEDFEGRWLATARIGGFGPLSPILWTAPVANELLDLRCGICEGKLVAVGKDRVTGEYLATIDGAPVISFGLSFGDNSCAVGPDGLYLVRNSRRIDVVSLAGVLLRVISTPETSQGIRDVTPEGDLRLGDAWFVRRYELPAGGTLTLTQPVLRGVSQTVIVGQSDPPQIAGIGPTGQVFTAFTGYAYEPHVAALPDGRYTVCARTPNGPRLVLLPPYLPLVGAPPKPPEATIGPLSPPRAEDGRVYDLQPFLIGAPETWPRSGPTHPMHQDRAGDVLRFVKFANPTTYEAWAVDAEWIYHLEDASNIATYSFSDPRWFPRRIPIGEAHAFLTGEHRMITKARGSCARVSDQPFARTMWLQAVWDRYDCGPDLGVRAVICMAYDPTGGAHSPARLVELFYFALRAGWFRWESHRSNDVYAHGPARFDDSTRKDRSDFYLRGGPAMAPALTNCAPLTIPTFPPWTPTQEPKPVSQPTPHQWIDIEFPQLEAQFAKSGLGLPNANMAAFLTLRRYGYFPGEVWSFERLMADLVKQGQDNGSLPKEAP